MTRRQNITADQLREKLTYDPASGLFTRISNGLIAGSINARGYRYIFVCGQLLKSNRLAWLYMTGTWPERDVDHRDTIKTNDQWANLRLAEKWQNSSNRHPRKGSKWGIKGIYFHKQSRKWGAQIGHKRRNIHIGLYSTMEEAAAAYREAAIRLHGEFARIE